MERERSVSPELPGFVSTCRDNAGPSAAVAGSNLSA